MSRHGENIRKRKDGRWEARYIQGHDQNGKAKYRYIYAKTYRDVKKKRDDEIAEQKLFTKSCSNEPTDITFDTICNEWLSEKKDFIKESTYGIYRNLINIHILPELGSSPMRNMNQTLFQQFLLEKQRTGRADGTGGLSSKTVSDIYTILKQILHYAQHHGFPEAALIQLTPIANRQPEIQVLTAAEQKNWNTSYSTIPARCIWEF